MIGHWQAIAIAFIAAALLGAGFYIKGVIASNKAMKIELAEKVLLIEKIKTALDTVVKNVGEQNEAITGLRSEMIVADTEAKEAMQVFAKHNLQALSAAKPGLIEKRVNKATQEVFLVMQQDTENFYREVSQ
jgi:hypothetical protein